MTWLCKCGATNVNYSEHCAKNSCRSPRTEIGENDEFDDLLRKVREYQIRDIVNLNTSQTWGLIGIQIAIHNRDRELNRMPMTPQEELFSQLFNHEKQLVKDMNTLELRAHREELAKIAFEARARLTAVDDEENGRKKKKSDSQPTGFERSLNVDDTATQAINTIKDRQKRLSKAEKIQQGLEKLGISTVDAAKLMSAGTILGRIKSQIKGGANPPIESEEEKKPVFNPFAK